jgi:hypothetical protein
MWRSDAAAHDGIGTDVVIVVLPGVVSNVCSRLREVGTSGARGSQTRDQEADADLVILAVPEHSHDGHGQFGRRG